MEFKLKQICLAVGLPFLAFLSLYWLKQRKKIGDGRADENAVGVVAEQADPKSGDQAAVQADCKADQSNSESTVESQSTDCCARTACCKADNRESIDQDKAISTDNQTPVQPAKLAALPDDSPVKLNNNDNDFKSKDPANDSQTASKPESKPESKSSESKSIDRKSPEHKSPEQQSTESNSERQSTESKSTEHESPVSKSTEKQSPELPESESRSLTNDSQSADNSADRPEKSNRQQDSANQTTGDALDLNKPPANEEANELHSSSKSLVEGEEMFETNNDPTRRQSLNASVTNTSIANVSTANVSTANASTMNNESAKADTTSLTFNTARDLSINDSSIRLEDQSIDQSLGHSFADQSSIIDYASSANATVNSSIRSLKDSTLGSINCSAQTLRSSDDKDAADQPDGSKTSNAAGVHAEEEVKEDYSNAANRSNRSLNSTVNSTMNNDIDPASLLGDAKPNDSRGEETVEEKQLNVTETEFKNDTLDQVVQGLEGLAISGDETVSEASATIKHEQSASEEAAKTEDNHDDSIIFDGFVKAEDRKPDSRPARKAKAAQNGLATGPENAAKVSPAKENAVKEGAVKESPVKVNAAKESPTKESPSKSSPVKESPSKASPVKENPAKVSPAKETSSPKPAANLDDSDVQIVFETCEDIKPKQLPNVNGRATRAKDEKSVAGTPSKAMNQQVPNNHVMDEFTFEIPKDLCGLLIGAKGGFINPTMRQTNTQITLLNHPSLANMNLVSIKGHYNGIREALAIIRERFPLSRFPQVTLQQKPNLVPVETISEAAQLHLPEGVHCDVILSDCVSPKHLFLQQPTHASFYLLQRLDEYMISTYNFNETPTVDEPAVGIICAVQRGEGWFRAIVTDCSGPIKVRLLDYGGFLTVPKTALRQVQREMMSLPFQAVECMLANVEPVNGVWTAEANNYFRSVTEKQILQAFIVGYTEERIPLIQLYRIVENQAILINKEIIDSGFAVFVN